MNTLFLPFIFAVIAKSQFIAQQYDIKGYAAGRYTLQADDTTSITSTQTINSVRRQRSTTNRSPGSLLPKTVRSQPTTPKKQLLTPNHHIVSPQPLRTRRGSLIPPPIDSDTRSQSATSSVRETRELKRYASDTTDHRLIVDIRRDDDKITRVKWIIKRVSNKHHDRWEHHKIRYLEAITNSLERLPQNTSWVLNGEVIRSSAVSGYFTFPRISLPRNEKRSKRDWYEIQANLTQDAFAEPAICTVVENSTGVTHWNATVIPMSPPISPVVSKK